MYSKTFLPDVVYSVPLLHNPHSETSATGSYMNSKQMEEEPKDSQEEEMEMDLSKTTRRRSARLSTQRKLSLSDPGNMSKTKGMACMTYLSCSLFVQLDCF